MKSRRGASFQILSRLGSDAYTPVVSVSLVMEYEATVMRFAQAAELDLTVDDVSVVVDYICSVAEHQRIYYLWRPFLPDANDDMILEVAVSGRCDAIITHNVRDFAGAEQFGIQILAPKVFLGEIV
ncbi:MAG: PIN domain-containing protein [Chloroflexi bacterium]|nr:PIN domain-containing protein [Chloroflexota bacterium]